MRRVGFFCWLGWVVGFSLIPLVAAGHVHDDVSIFFRSVHICMCVFQEFGIVSLGSFL